MDPCNLTIGAENTAGLDPAAAPIVAEYLAALESRLPVGRRARRDILAEIADGLCCAVADQIERGVAPHVAAGTAVTRCGDPALVAATFRTRIGLVTAGRVGAGLLAGGPLVGLVWLSAYTSGPSVASRINDVFVALPIYPLILAITVPSAVIAVIGAGRWGHVRGPVTTAAALVAAVGCAVGDVSLLSMAALRPVGHGGTSVLAAAVLVSIVRLSAAGWSGFRLARLRALGA